MVNVFLFTPDFANADCSAGGPGSSSCSVTVQTIGGGVTYSVECREGYYACCNALGAGCLRETPIP